MRLNLALKGGVVVLETLKSMSFREADVTALTRARRSAGNHQPHINGDILSIVL